MEKILTTDRGGGVEDAGYLRVHVDHHVLVCLQLLVAFIDALLHPSCEVSLCERVDHVRDVGSWQFPRQKLRLGTKFGAICSQILTEFHGGQPAGTS